MTLPSFAFSVQAGSEDSLLRLLSSSKDTSRIQLLCKLASATYSTDLEKGLRYAEQALSEAGKGKFRHGMAEANKLLGVIHYYKGDYDKALSNYIASQKDYESVGDKRGMAALELEIGNLYKKTERYDEALRCFRHASGLLNETQDSSQMANTFNNLGLVWEAKQNLDSAIYYYSRSLDTYTAMQSDLGMSYSLDYLSGAWLQKKDHTRAFSYEQKALELRLKLNSLQAAAISYNNLGEILKDKKDLKAAIDYFQKSIDLARSTGYRDLAQYSCKQVAECYAGLNNAAKAYEYLSMSNEIKDSLYNETRSKQLAEMQTKYETDKKQKENEILSQQGVIKDLELDRKQRTIYVTLGLSLLAILILMLLYFNYRSRQRELMNTELLKQEQMRNKAIIITQENERKRISEELHDGLGQMLSAVKLNVAALEDNLREKNLQYNNAVDLIDESCRELRNISHSMMPGILIKAGLIPAIKEFVDKINSSGAIKIRVEAEETKMRLSDTIEINFFRIIQELINNIIRYAHATNVQVSVTLEKNILSIMLEDDGKGFDKNVLKTSAGNGWNNINSRLLLLSGKIEIDSSPGKGTVVFVEVPLIH